MPPGTVKVDRSTRFGNPFVPGKENPLIRGRLVEDQRHAVKLFAGHAPNNPGLVAEIKADLAGKTLGCWCRLCERHRDGKPFGFDCEACEPCHADVLGRIAAS